MTAPIDSQLAVLAGQLLVRWTQVTAAMTAVGLSADAAWPFVEAFRGPLADRVEVGATGDRTRASIRTWGDAVTIVEGVRALLGPEGLDRMDAVQPIAGLYVRLQPSEAGASVELDADGAAAFRVDFVGRWSRTAVHAALEAVGVTEAALAEYRSALAYLDVRWVERVAVSLDLATGDATFVVSFERVTAASDGSAVAEATAAAASLGTSAMQCRWVTAVHDALTPRPQNRTPVTLTLSRDALQPRVTLTYADIPPDLVLAALHGVLDGDDHGAVLGRVQGAMGAGDAVHRFAVTLHPAEPPGLAYVSRPV